jgi:hypothetical protein
MSKRRRKRNTHQLLAHGLVIRMTRAAVAKRKDQAAKKRQDQISTSHEMTHRSCISIS